MVRALAKDLSENENVSPFFFEKLPESGSLKWLYYVKYG